MAVFKQQELPRPLSCGQAGLDPRRWYMKKSLPPLLLIVSPLQMLSP